MPCAHGEEPNAEPVDELLAECRQQLGRCDASVWTAEMRRQQTAIANEMVRHAMRFWTGAWMAPSAGHKPKRRG
jgi:hypothetical protein